MNEAIPISLNAARGILAVECALLELLSASEAASSCLRQAVAHVWSPGLRMIVDGRASEWAAAVLSLQALVAELGGIAEERQDAMPAPVDALENATHAKVLADCERAESAALQVWAHALRKEIPREIRLRLAQQYVALWCGQGELRRWVGIRRGTSLP
ncbi:MAG TPA: hypothetical protein VGM74_00525 [Burkholderiaceae bacterium]